MSIDAFNKLKEELLSCQKCKDIFENDPRPVFQGNRDSVIMQISQAHLKKSWKLVNLLMMQVVASC